MGNQTMLTGLSNALAKDCGTTHTHTYTYSIESPFPKVDSHVFADQRAFSSLLAFRSCVCVHRSPNVLRARAAERSGSSPSPSSCCCRMADSIGKLLPASYPQHTSDSICPWNRYDRCSASYTTTDGCRDPPPRRSCCFHRSSPLTRFPLAFFRSLPG